MKFTYTENTLSIKTDHLVEIEFFFQNNDCTHVYIDEQEFPAYARAVTGLFVYVGGEIYKIFELLIEAEMAWPRIIEEVRRDQIAEERHEDYLRSIELTGRI